MAGGAIKDCAPCRSAYQDPISEDRIWTNRPLIDTRSAFPLLPEIRQTAATPPWHDPLIEFVIPFGIALDEN